MLCLGIRDTEINKYGPALKNCIVLLRRKNAVKDIIMR